MVKIDQISNWKNNNKLTVARKDDRYLLSKKDNVETPNKEKIGSNFLGKLGKL